MSQEKARFDGQLPAEQKHYFEQAAMLGGYRTLTEFVFSSAQQKADEIVQHHHTLLASEKDRDLFFAALMNSPEPHAKLQEAAKRYQQATQS